MQIDNIITLSVLFVYIIPAILYVNTYNIRELFAIIGITGSVAASEGIKYFVIKERSTRPSGATDCNLWCTDGLQEGKPGMPSGHSLMATFFAGYYFNETDNIWIKCALVIFAIAIMISRYTKRCHSVEQIIVGSLLGLGMSQVVRTIYLNYSILSAIF